MVGLTVGGLVQGLHVIGKLQTAAGASVRDDRTLRAAGQGFARLLESGGPFVSDGKGLSGDASEVDFTCGGGCGVHRAAPGRRDPIRCWRSIRAGSAATAYRFKGVEALSVSSMVRRDLDERDLAAEGRGQHAAPDPAQHFGDRSHAERRCGPGACAPVG